MADTTRLDNYKRRLDEYYAAESAIIGGAQSYKIGSREFTRGALAEVQKMIAYLERQVSSEQSANDGRGRNRVFGVVPRDF